MGLHYVGTELREAVGIVADRSAWHVAPDGAGGYRETEIPARYWLPSRWSRPVDRHGPLVPPPLIRDSADQFPSIAGAVSSYGGLIIDYDHDHVRFIPV